MPHFSALFRLSTLSLGLIASNALAQYGNHNDVPAKIVDAAEKIQAVLIKHPVTNRVLGQCDGPALDGDGNLFFSESSASIIYKVTPQGSASVFYEGQNDSARGMEFDPQGRLVVCANGALLRFDKAGVKETLVASPDFKSLHDISIGSTGAMFVTNLTSGHTLFYVSADGKTIVKTTGIASPSGVEWVEDKNILYVSERDATTTWKFTVGTDGALTGKVKYVPDIPGADGLTLDDSGHVYIAGYAQGAVHLYSTPVKDPFLGHIYVTGSTTTLGNNTNQVFGGTGRKTLYMTGNGGCFKLLTKMAGRIKPGFTVGIQPQLNDASAIWKGLQLSQATFNPSINSLNILYPSSASEKNVQIGIFDLNNHKVWGKSLGYGQNSLQWNGQDNRGNALASGYYVVVAQSGKKVLSAKPVKISKE